MCKLRKCTFLTKLKSRTQLYTTKMCTYVRSVKVEFTDPALILTSYKKEINVNYRVNAGELLR